MSIRRFILLWRKPDRLGFGATASLAALSATAALPLGTALGARGTLTRSHTRLLFRVNGTTSEFTHEPEGRDASIIAALKYRTGEVRLFAIDQWNQLGVMVDQPSFAGALDSDGVHASQVLTWEQTFGDTRLTFVAGNTDAENRVSYGALDVEVRDRLRQFRAHAELRPSAGFGVTGGVELTARDAAFTGRTPRYSHDDRPIASLRISVLFTCTVRVTGTANRRPPKSLFKFVSQNALRITRQKRARAAMIPSC